MSRHLKFHSVFTPVIDQKKLSSSKKYKKGASEHVLATPINTLFV